MLSTKEGVVEVLEFTHFARIYKFNRTPKIGKKKEISHEIKVSVVMELYNGPNFSRNEIVNRGYIVNVRLLCVRLCNAAQTYYNENIIETSQRQAYHAVDTILSQRNWLIGYRIAAEEIDGSDRAEYGANIIKKLSKELTAQYGKGYDRSNLYHCLRFYKEFPQIVDTACRQSHIRLSWSHYRALLQVADSSARNWYEKEAYEQTWGVRTLQRNINTQYYYRIL